MREGQVRSVKSDPVDPPLGPFRFPVLPVSYHRVADGGTAIDPEVVAQLFSRRRANDRIALLSPREHEVLSVMAEGR